MPSHTDQPAEVLESIEVSSSPTPKMYSPIFESHADFYAHLSPESQQKLVGELERLELTPSQELVFKPQSKDTM